MTQGHFSLGPLGDVRPYMFADPRQFRRALANQMVVPTGSGEAKYANKDAYSSRVWHTWTRGIGQEADQDGALYAEMDTRIGHQLNLPPLVKLTDGKDEDGAATDIRNQIGDVTGVLTAGEGGSDRIAIYVDGSAGSLAMTKIWLYARIPPNTTATVALYGVDGSNKPTGSPSDTATISGDVDYNFHWYLAAITETLGAEHCIVVYPTLATNTVELACGASYTNSTTWVSDDDGSTWAAGSLYPFFLTDIDGLNSKASVVDIVRFNSQTYAAVGNRIYKYSTSNQNWASVGAARSTTITDLEVWEGNLYIGLGDGTNLDTMNTSESYTNGSVQARLFHKGQGYLWRSDGENVYYSADGSSWSSAIVVGPSDFSVRGFATSQSNVYVATDDGLWWIAPGDIPVGVAPFPGASSVNGKDMLAYEGNVYIPVDGHFYQFTEMAALQNIWKSRPEELPSSKLGDVVTTCATSHMLLVGVQPDSSTGAPTVWSWNGEGWHFMAALPNGLTLTCLRYDRSNSRIWCGTSTGHIFWFYVSDYLVNPTRDSAYTFMPFGWLETDWFASEILEDYKDFDGVFVLAREISAANPVEVYYQDDASSTVLYIEDEAGLVVTDEAGDPLSYPITVWNFLGEYTGERQEIRFDLDSTARNSREIRLGLLVTTRDVSVTPKVEALRLKFHLMITDWSLWSFGIEISGTETTPQQLVDGTVQEYSREQMRAHLWAMAAGYTPPVLFTSPDNITYEVKVKDASEVPLGEFKWIDGALKYDSVMNVVLEQTWEGEYE